MSDDGVQDAEASGPIPLTGAWCDELAAMIADARINLVSRADRAAVRQLHINESVAIARRIKPGAGSSWMDLGTGGGLPGLVLAASFPRVHWTLVDARAKKIAHVGQFAVELGLTNVTVVHARAEELSKFPEHQGQYAGVVARAVASLEVTIALGRGFVEDGELIVVRGPKARKESAALVRWSDDLGIALETVERISGTMRPTWLIRVRGRGPAPVRFPQARRRLLNSARGGTR